MEFSLEDAATYFPMLSDAHRKRLYEELRRLSEGLVYYFPQVRDPRLQGDTVQNAPYIAIVNGRPDFITSRAMILSNSCDVCADNPRDVAPYITLAPVQRVSRFRAMLEAAGLAPEKIDAKLDSVRKQQVTTAFYLPAGGGLAEEAIAHFDQVQSLPLSEFDAREPIRLNALSQTAHWLLLLKLAAHFCRLHEGVVRFSDDAAVAA